MHPLSEELLLKNALPIRIVDRQTTSSHSRKGENTKKSADCHDGLCYERIFFKGAIWTTR